MDRTDSAFDEAFRLNMHEKTIHRGNTAPTQERRIKTPPPLSSANFQSTAIRPASEKRSSTRRSAEPRRKSLTSSSDDSTNKSRRQKHGSLPSSRRTSCTIVDPSRPARHYRIKSSQTVPTSTGDIDDVLALHFRSCSIFQNPSYHQASSLPSPSLSGKFPRDSVGDGTTTTDFGVAQPSPPGTMLHVATSTPDYIEPESPMPIEHEQTISDTTMHWISPSTRRDQYRKFDRQNKGLRGLVRKFLPRCVSGPPALQFYEQDRSDAGSVRRYRMDVDDDEEDEKDALRRQQRKPERSVTDLNGKKKWWGCI